MAAKKPTKITVLMDTEEFALFDNYCAEHGFKKSTLIVRLVREHLAREGVAMEERSPRNQMHFAKAK